MDQPARMAALDSFRRGEVELLIASDVAARGLDIPEVSHVFNFDVPHHPDDYVHRIGRTGRAGRAGTAITIVAPIDGKAVSAIERLTGQTIPWMDKKPAAGAEEIQPAHDSGKRHRADHARDGRRDRHPARRPKKSTPAHKAPARPENEESEAAHLPAFLLRPVSIKA
jgi:superfamily II DNA/RNA helicase